MANPTTVIKSIGSASRDYLSIESWDAAAPSNLTTTRANTTQAGSTSSTIKLDAAASAVDSFYVGHAVWCDARTSEIRLISAYVGATKIATIVACNGSNATWDNTPGTEAYTIDTVIWQGECYNDSDAGGGSTFLDGGANPFITGNSTTSASYYRHLTTASGQSFQNHANVRTNALFPDQTKGVLVKMHTGYIRFMTGSENYFRISKLQIWVSVLTGYRALYTGGTGSIWKDIIIRHDGGVNNENPISMGFSAKTINVVVCTTDAAGQGCAAYTSSAFIGCTVVKCSNRTDSASKYAFKSEYGDSLQISSCAAFNYPTGFSNGATTFTGGNNATDKASGAPGSGNQYTVSFNATTPFTQASSTSTDLKAIAATSLAANGVLDSTNAPNDISNTARANPPTIGAWEIGGGGGGGSNWGPSILSPGWNRIVLP